MLEAPLIDRGFLSHVGDELESAAEGAISEEAKSVVQGLIRTAIDMVRTVFGL